MKLNTRILPFFIIILLLSVTGCTRNDGDIGLWFGRWRLEKMTCDGVDMNLYDADDIQLIYWSFQGKILRIGTLRDHNFDEGCFAGWTDDNGQLILDFTAALDNVENPGIYCPPEILHFNRGEICILNIDKLTGKQLDLSYTADDGHIYRYFLKKAI